MRFGFAPLGTLVMLASLLVVPAGLSGCQGEVTENDLQLWTHNDRGLARMREVITDPQQPLTTRVRALEVVVEKGFSGRIVDMIDGIADREDQQSVVKPLIEALMVHLEKRDEAQFDAKDALMRMQRYVDEDGFEPIRVAVAKWAFNDIDWNTAKQDVKAKIESRISMGQVRDLNEHGWETAAILVSHGFTDKTLAILSSAKDAEATKLMLRGLKKLHANDQVGMHHIEAVAKTGNAAAAKYLFDLYHDTKLAQDFRGVAFNAAMDILEAKSIKENPGELPAELLKLMEGKNPEDRWLAAINLMTLTGVDHLEEVLKRFKDDKVYGNAEEDPQKSIIDFCFDIYDGGHGEKAKGIFMKHLTDPNRIVRAISTVCLKSNEAFIAKAPLAALVKPPEDPTDVSIEDFLGNGYKLGPLAQNAIDGLAMLEQARNDEKAGKLTAEQSLNKRAIIKFELQATGDAYKQIVASRYQAWVNEQAKAKADAAKPKEDAAKPKDAEKKPADSK